MAATPIVASDGAGSATVDVVGLRWDFSSPTWGYVVRVTNVGPTGAPISVEVNGRTVWSGRA